MVILVVIPARWKGFQGTAEEIIAKQRQADMLLLVQG